MSDNKDNKKLGFGKASLGSAAGGGRPKSPRQPAPKEASQYRQLQASLISQVRRLPFTNTEALQEHPPVIKQYFCKL